METDPEGDPKVSSKKHTRMTFSFSNKRKALRLERALTDLDIPAKLEFSGGTWVVETSSRCLGKAVGLVTLL